jgi:hypothetical protein
MSVAARYSRPYRGPIGLMATLALLVCAATASAASPRDELLRYVPDDVGFCFILQDFRDQLNTLAASPFSQELDKSPLGQAFATAKEFKDLVEIEKQLKQLLGLSSVELRDDILGDAVVFAFRPAPPNKPEKEEGLILLRARDEKKLHALVDHLNAAQKKSGQLTSLDEREHNGVKYLRRVETKETNYYYLRGSVLLYSGQESILKDALDRERTTTPATEPALSRRLREANLPRGLFTAWINARAFDDLLAAKTKETKVQSDVAFLQNFTHYWKALDGAFVSLAVDKELSLTVSLQGRSEAFPAAARKLFGEAAKPSELTAVFPENALLATAVRLDAAALLEVFGDFMTKENRETFQKQLNFGGVLGKNYLRDVGPDAGLIVYAPSATEKGWLPHAVVALRTGPGDDPQKPTDREIVSLLESFAKVAVLSNNQQHPEQLLELTKVRQDKRDVHTLVGDKVFPPGMQPSLSLVHGFLVVADAPQTIQQFADALAKARKAPPNETGPLLRISLKDWRHYLKERREPFVQSMMERDKITNKEASERLDNLLGVLQFVDRLEISRRATTDRMTVTIAVQTAYPLKK